MFSNRTETEQITTEDASSEFKLVTETITGDGNTEVEARYVLASEDPQPIVRTANAGDSADVVVANILAGADNYGYNAANGEYGDMIELGIIDPTKVTKTALVNAASIASLLLTSECTITVIPKKDEAGTPGMGMM